MVKRPYTSWLSSLSYDVNASISVALVALPLCLGIAYASSAPPLAGLIAGVVGGVVVGIISNSHTSVSGPAAGLTAVIVTAIAALDGRFEVLLISVVLAGLIQIALGWAKAGFLAKYFPNAIVRGLLAAIGLILVFKQIPHAFGIDRDPEGDFSFWQIDQEDTFSEIVHIASRVSPGALTISLSCLLLILVWDNTRLRRLRLPSSLLAVTLGAFINALLSRYHPAWALSGEHLVQLPKFESFGDLGALMSFPSWSALATPQLSKIVLIAFEIAIVASLETLLNIEAIDKLDPQRRTTSPDRELIAQGVGNAVAGLLGGLPVTSVVVRSSMNVSSGGRTKTAAILHGAILFLSILAVPGLLNLIPLSALAAVLLVTGFKLASPRVFAHFYKRGWSQFMPFVVTVAAILFSDLLIGIVIGMLSGVFFILRTNSRVGIRVRKESYTAGDIYRVKFGQQVSFLNRASVMDALAQIPDDSDLILDASATNDFDQDVLDLLLEFRDEEATKRNLRLSFVGFRSELIDEQVEYVNVLTKETQNQLTPTQVLEKLKEGNRRFVNGERNENDLLRQVALTGGSQAPMAVIVGCIDSRTSSELIFDLGLGDIFSVRVAGNVINEDIVGSLEYATSVVGAKLIVVKGHKNCGAINAACDHVRLGNVTQLLNKIGRAIERETATKTDRNSQNAKYVANVTWLNVENSIQDIFRMSSIVRNAVARGEVAIVGAVYDTFSGIVEFSSSAEPLDKGMSQSQVN
ncbi:MAG: bifunctional SulP family inorganic anion transporter/carbonic anhydrase [Planctomycetales bacterium]|nr:bifunctional SulP family inorganic anion transporter/carbonic anhydrase [Planctomycetales bacterium]